MTRSILKQPSPNPDVARTWYRELILPRLIEEKMLRLIRQGRISKWFSGYGQEAIAVGCTLALDRNDYILPMHRNLGVWTTRGVPLKPLFCQLLGREGGFTRGRDRTFHFGLPEYRIVGMISHLGAMLPVACGLGLASQLRRKNFVALVMTGEGATREGDFHEALSLAGAWRLPVVFVVENNGYGLSTPVHEALPIEDIADVAAGYGMPGEVVDGNDLGAVVEAVSRAAARAREGQGPALLEMKTFRMRGHEEASGTKYVPQELLEHWAERDPIHRYTSYVESEALLSVGEIEAIRSELAAAVEEAVEYALVQPDPVSSVEDERRDVFAVRKHTEQPFTDQNTQSSKRFIDAISDGLHEVLDREPDTLLMGQDIAEYGGVFKVTQGFVQEFGHSRVRNTPIMESGVVGAALGLALEGFHPIVEMQYADFISCAFNQIANNLSTTHYRWGAPVGVTIRAPFGGGIGAGPFHSQSVESWFCHIPGLKVVVPATPEDAKGLLIASVMEPNPVLYLEHKALYRSIEGPVPQGWYEVPLGKARVARLGSDLTIVTYGVGVHWALEEAVRQSEMGRSLEIIDLRTLIPWDRETVLTSIRKTNRLLVLHEAARTGGFGAEIAASVVEEAFEYLDAPPVRIASEDTPIPFAAGLERQLYSAHTRLAKAVEHLCSY